MNLLLAILLTQSLQLQPYGPLGRTFPPGISTKVMDLPLTRSGQGFDCTGALSCLSWNGSALVESTGLSWTQNGTVPQVAATSLPTTASTGAAGPFSDANYYSYPTASDPLDSTGDRFGCVAFVDAPASRVLLWNGAASNVAGYGIGLSAGSALQFTTQVPAMTQVNSGTSAVAGAYNVGCWWRTGTSINSKVNLGATGTNASGGTEVAGTAYTAKIGRYENAGLPFTGQILHVVQGLGACPTPPAPFAATCEGWATHQMARQFGMVGPRGEVLSLTRTTTNGAATYNLNGRTWSAANGVPRITTDGLLAERAGVNASLNTRDLTNVASWASTGTPTITPDQGPAGVTDLEKVQSNANADARYNTTTVTSSTGPWAVSFTVASDSGSKVESILFGINGGQTLTGCSCYRESGAACTTATTTSNQAFAYGTFTTTPERFTITCSATTAQTTIYPGVHDGQYNSTNSVGGLFGRLQTEIGATSSSECPSGASACLRGADVPSVSTPAAIGEPDWCVSITGTPYGGASWGLGRGLWGAGNYASTNSASAGGNGTTFFAGYAKGSDGVANYATYNAVSTLTGPLTIRSVLRAPNVTATIGGAPASSFSATGTGLIGSVPATTFLGTAANPFDGYLRDFRIYRSPSCR